MPLWGTPQSGNNPISALNFTDLRAGDDLDLFDGTETIVSGSKSIAFARGYVPGSNLGRTYQITGCPNGSVMTLYASNGVSASGRNPIVTPTLANMDASFNTTGVSSTGNGSFSDNGSSSFYRIVCTTFAAGDVPVVIVRIG